MACPFLSGFSQVANFSVLYLCPDILRYPFFVPSYRINIAASVTEVAIPIFYFRFACLSNIIREFFQGMFTKERKKISQKTKRERGVSVECRPER